MRNTLLAAFAVLASACSSPVPEPPEVEPPSSRPPRAGDEASTKATPQPVAEGAPVGAAASACIIWGPPPHGVVADDTFLVEGSAAGEDLVANDTVLAEGAVAR